MNKKELVLSLEEIGAIKFGEFTLKSGLKSPFYFDLRDMISQPELLEATADLLIEKIKDLPFDVITGIPYTALPIATLVAAKLKKPLIYMRKEEKAYGTGKKVIGTFSKGDVCLVIDDLITTGESKIETAEALEKEGLKIRDFVVVIDRSKDGEKSLKARNYQLHSLVSLTEILEILHQHKKINDEKMEQVRLFTEQINTPQTTEKRQSVNNLTEKLLAKIQEKQSNLILSLDVDEPEKFFAILEQVADEIVMLKTHIDIMKNANENFINKLQEYAEKYNFLLFEDRKFADIGSTVRKQYKGGIYKIADWAEFVTVHMIAGEGILQGLFDGLENRSSFLLARMSSKDNLISEDYTRKVLQIGEKYAHCVSGFIGHGNSVEDIKRFRAKIPANMLLLMPGVQLEKGGDAMGQQYITVEDAISGGADCIIVGRGIYGSENQKETAAIYRDRAWKMFLEMKIDGN
jgi:orotidine 5'-phosphate decarboxylase subfamily 1/orotate phosphoribosyltransferase